MTYTEVKRHDPYLFIKNFASANDIVDGKLSDSKRDEMIAIVHSHNDDVAGFVLNDSVDVRLQTVEADTFGKYQPMFHLHSGNITRNNPKWTSIITITDHNDTVGGDMMIRDLQQQPQRDNYGDWIGNPDDPYVPGWASNFGSLVVVPSVSIMGYNLCTEGPIQRLYYDFTGVYK